MILLYIGAGKGKTSACLGQALRALGYKYPVSFCQFIKRPGTSGEQVMLRQLLGQNYRVQGLGFVAKALDRRPHRVAAKELLSWAMEQLALSWILIADEILYARGYDLLDDNDLTALVARAKETSCHLVLSGRNAPPWLVMAADCVTEMTPVRHPYEQGSPACRGLDF